MGIKKIISILLVILIPAMLFTGCGDKNQVKYGYNSNYKINTVDSQIIAQNSKLILRWDDSLKCVSLENSVTGKIWSNIPMDKYEAGEYRSTLDISVQDMEIYQSEFFSSEDLYNNGKISCEKIENGIRVTYYFDKAKISVPIEYTLRKDSMLVSIDGAKIGEEAEQYRLVSVSVAPLLCSVTHGKENSYIFVPEGNGALMYTNIDADGNRKITIGSANVASHDDTSGKFNSESTGMRVFGIKDDVNALMCIAEDTAGAVGISASAGDKKTDYSNVYPVFNFVDADYFYGKATNAAAVRHLSDRTQSKISVGFYPLSNEEADYNGMAKRYRKYLTDKGYISDDKCESASPYSLTMLGGVLTTSSSMGIPVKTVKSMTDYAEAQKITESITKLTGIKPVVRLKGYTESGINYGEIAGGYDFSSEIGSAKEREKFEKYCKDNNIPLYFDFDLLKYSESGSGFSYSGDSAKTAVLHPAEKSGVNVPLRDANSNMTYRLIKRSKIKDAVNKLKDMIEDEKLSGVSITSLGQISYSDYSDGIKYAVTGGMEKDTVDSFKTIKKTGALVSASAATYFVAGLVDTVFDAPLGISGKYQYDIEIPFYQMVYSGVTPLYSSAINLSSVPQQKIMMAASTGTGLGFTVINEFNKNFMETSAEKLYACVYEENKELIKSALDKYSEIYKAIDNSKIKNYDILENKVTKTVFENGVVVYANNSSDKVLSPIGELDGFDFRMEREGV